MSTPVPPFTRGLPLSARICIAATGRVVSATVSATVNGAAQL